MQMHKKKEKEHSVIHKWTHDPDNETN